ncbi:MAG: ferrochelatase [Xanthomonadales bacterium]|nr:ferrochelatase [Xanthomonadales bacterium]
MKDDKETDRRGVLVANLGTPESPDPRGVAKFLRAFLSDPRVVDLPRWLWLPLLNLVIIPLRCRRSAAAYRSIWLPAGSPLLVLTRRLAQKLATRMHGVCKIATGMRYGEPSIRSALEDLRQGGVNSLAVLPLYPQFSGTTTSSIYDAVDQALQDMNWHPQLSCINEYHLHPAWVAAVASSIVDFRKKSGAADKLVFSLHGIPQRYVANGDPYEQHCRASVAAIARAAQLEEDEWLLTFQSRVGREPWLMPYTDLTLKQLAQQGVRHVQVVCPGFAVDCLETLEEIAMQNHEMFIAAGGHSLDYIPALNDSHGHVEALREVLTQSPGPINAGPTNIS